MTTACGPQPDTIRLTIQNSGNQDTAVLLGYALGNGEVYLPREFIVEVTSGDGSQTEPLVFQRPLRLAGRIDNWIVPLPQQASFTLVLRAFDFIPLTTRSLPFKAEQLRVRLTGKTITNDLNPDLVGLRNWHVWTGEAASNTLDLRQCEH